MQKWDMEEWEGEKTRRDGGWGGREVGKNKPWVLS